MWCKVVAIATIAIIYLTCAISTEEECAPNWHRFEDRCFFVNLTSVHSKYNKELCDSLNASMVSVHGEAENEFIRRLLFIHYESHKWVWLSRSRNYNKTHGFLWADNTPLDYANWVAPDVDCNVCCEVSLMQSGHWYASNCNTWTFSQLCVRKLATTAANQPVQLGDNFYLSQFGASVDTKVPEIEPNITELVEWLAYEVESVREELHQLNDTNRILIDEYIYERDYYVHVLLSLTVTLLVIIVTLVILSYHMLLRKLDNMGSFCDK